jgi:hypothetical protein
LRRIFLICAKSARQFEKFNAQSTQKSALMAQMRATWQLCSPVMCTVLKITVFKIFKINPFQGYSKTSFPMRGVPGLA